MPVGVFKSQQLAVWLFSDVADDLHIFAFQPKFRSILV